MIARFLVVVASAVLLTGGLGAGDEKKNDKDKLQGEWALVKAVVQGQEQNADEIKAAKPLVIKGDEWTATSGGKFMFSIDSTKSPKHLDLRRQKSSDKFVYRGIYKLEGDTLTFCRTPGFAGERPAEFTAGKDVTLLQFKRLGK